MLASWSYREFDRPEVDSTLVGCGNELYNGTERGTVPIRIRKDHRKDLREFRLVAFRGEAKQNVGGKRKEQYVFELTLM
jgi:hypothetical protein